MADKLSDNSISEKLIRYFNSSCERLIYFWYDESKSYEDKIDSMEKGKCELIKLTGKNALSVKYIIEVEKPDTNFLVYAPFARKSDEEDALTDMFKYSDELNIDVLGDLCKTLQIDPKLRSEMEKYKQFWMNDKRVTLFKNYGISKFDSDILHIAMISAAIGSRQCDFVNALSTVLCAEPENKDEENSKLKEIETAGILDLFWFMADKKFTLPEQIRTNKNIRELITSLFLSRSAFKFESTSVFPNDYKRVLVKNLNEADIFVTSLMQNTEHMEQFDKLALLVQKAANIRQHLDSISISNYKSCDTFTIFDEKISSYLIKQLVEANYLKEEDKRLLEYRRQSSHYKNQFKEIYKAIKAADDLFRLTKEFETERIEKATSAERTIKLYTENWNRIDRSYRNYYAINNGILPDELSALTKKVEKVYCNDYLSPLSELWGNYCAEFGSYEDIPGIKQPRFYSNFVSPMVPKSATAVIISDAFRYECASELLETLNKMNKYSAKLENIIATIPAYTELGMAALLPNNKNITYKGNFDSVYIGEKSTAGIDARQSIIDEKRGKADDVVAIHYLSKDSKDGLKDLDRDEIRSKLAKKKLIYVYDNQVDNAGHKNLKVFNAVDDAILNIQDIITKLSNSLSIKRFIITADHGFIYTHDEVPESRRIPLDKLDNCFKDRRFILSNYVPEVKSSITFELNYLSDDMKGKYVTTPRSDNIYITSGSQKYSHGGMSLQELIVPVLSVEVGKGEKIQQQVQIELQSATNKIVNRIQALKFIQVQPVSDKLSAAQYELYFTDDAGNEITNHEHIIADSLSSNAAERIHTVTFNFGSKSYPKDKTYFLVISCNGAEIDRSPFTLDFMFDGFAF